MNLESVAKIWRGGCIIRAKLLEDICAAFRLNKNLPNLLLDPNICQKIMTHEDICVKFVKKQPCSIFACVDVTLSYLDAYRSTWQPTNLIQAQRDYFGAHTYERTDTKGTFHTEWEQDVST